MIRFHRLYLFCNESNSVIKTLNNKIWEFVAKNLSWRSYYDEKAKKLFSYNLYWWKLYVLAIFFFFFFFAKAFFCCNVLKLNKTLNWSQACVLYSSVIWLTKAYCACSKVLACNVNLVSRLLLLICANLWITINKSFTCNYWISLWKINHIKSFYGQID